MNVTKCERSLKTEIKDNSMTTTFTGAVETPKKTTDAPDIEVLAPKPRPSIQLWQSEHKRHKQHIADKKVRTIIIGDSLFKHGAKSNRTQ